MIQGGEKVNRISFRILRCLIREGCATFEPITELLKYAPGHLLAGKISKQLNRGIHMRRISKREAGILHEKAASTS